MWALGRAWGVLDSSDAPLVRREHCTSLYRIVSILSDLIFRFDFQIGLGGRSVLLNWYCSKLLQQIMGLIVGPGAALIQLAAGEFHKDIFEVAGSYHKTMGV